jgi:plastocyanin
MRLLFHTLFIPLITLALSIGYGLTDDADAADFEIAVKSGTKAFSPQEVKIKLGDKVTWMNKNQEDHFLTSAGPSSKQVVRGTEDLEIHKLLHPGESYTHSFTEPETYYYFCAIHMQMWGTVTVEK